MANISNFTALSKRVGTNKNLIDNPLTKTEQGIINRANTAQNKPVSTTPTTQPLVFKESTAAGVTPEPLFKETVNPIQAKLDSAVQQPQQGQTYAQSQNGSGLKWGTGSAAGMIDIGGGSFRPATPEEIAQRNGTPITPAPVVSDADTAERLMRDEFAKSVENAKKQGITLPYTDYESYKAWAQKPAQNAIDYTAQQQGIAQSIESSDVAKSLADIEAARAGTTASLAQGREGVQSAGNVLARQQFTTEMDRQAQKIRLQQQSNQLQRTQNMELLKRAQEEGNVKLASAIQDRIASLEKEQKQLDIDAKKAATDALDMAIKQQELGAKEKQNATTALISTFEKMGAGMANLSPEAITAMVEGTSVSPAAAIAWQAGEKLKAEAAKTKDEAEASYKLAQAEKLQAEIKNIGKTPDVLTYEYYNQLSQEGQAKFKEVLAMDKGSQLVKLDDGSLVIYNPTTSTMQRVPAGSPAISNMQNTDIQNVFTLEGTSKYRTDGGWECGEGANKITEGGKAGDTYASKLALVTKQDSPQIGNQIVLPIGSPNNGHIGTVISYDPTTRNVKTVEWNHNLDGKQTVESYNIDDLNKRYPPKGGKVQWGFSDSTLKPQYEEALNNAAVPPNDIEGMKIRAIVNGLGGTAGERNENMKNMKALIASGKAANAAEAKAQLGLITPEDKELQATMKAELQIEQKAVNEIMGQLAPAEQLLKTGTGMSDYTSIVGFLKAIDPGSVARESEVQSVQSAQGVLSNVFERLQNKSLTGEKLTQQQRDEMQQAINIIKTARASKYYEDLISRKLETENKGTPATFASKSEIAKYESWVGKEKADQIKKEVSERLGLTSSTYKLPGSPDVSPKGYISPK